MLSNDKRRTRADVWRRAAMLAGVALTVGLGACSNTDAKRPTGTTRRSANAEAVGTSQAETASRLRVDADSDNDFKAAADDTRNSELEFGRPATRAELGAIVPLVMRFYRVALAEDGGAACSMLYSTLVEAAPEDYGSFAGPPYMRGTTCPEILTKEFAHFHALLTIEVPKLKVARLRMEEHHGRAILDFGPHLPERELGVAREGRTWRIDALFDGELS